MTFINESDLIDRFKQGDPSAFEAIVRGHQDRIYYLFRYTLQDPQNAQDAAQDEAPVMCFWLRFMTGRL